MNIDEIWQSQIKSRIDREKDRKEREYILWQHDLILQINCECAKCEVNKRNWR